MLKYPETMVVADKATLHSAGFGPHNRVLLPRSIKANFDGFAQALASRLEMTSAGSISLTQPELQQAANGMNGYDMGAMKFIMGDMGEVSPYCSILEVRIIRKGYNRQKDLLEAFHPDGVDRYFSVYAGADMLHLAHADASEGIKIKTDIGNGVVYKPKSADVVFSMGLTSMWKQTGYGFAEEREKSGIKAALHSGQPDEIRMLLVGDIKGTQAAISSNSNVLSL